MYIHSYKCICLYVDVRKNMSALVLSMYHVKLQIEFPGMLNHTLRHINSCCYSSLTFAAG